MKIHILVVADGRSPTARAWIRTILKLGYEVSLISTFSCTPTEGLKDYACLPVAFSRFSSGRGAFIAGDHELPPSEKRQWVRRFAPYLQSLRYFLGPLTILCYQQPYRKLVQTWQPDLVHALRIPFEGMLASFTPGGIPFLTATWGNDLTLHAHGSFLMRWFTRRTLKHADGQTSDTHRDIELAFRWGLKPDSPSLVVPGSGGVDLDAIEKAVKFHQKDYHLSENPTWVVNSRGLRPGSVHQDVFFAAIPKVLTEQPETVFICPGLAGIRQAQEWVEKYGIQEHTFLLPKLDQPQLWALFKKAQLFVSPSSHDGTPNSLLEAMACGSFPIVGDIESMREWIVHDENGLLTDPQDPDQLARTIISALARPELRRKSADQNRLLIENRAALQVTRPKIDAFYHQFL